MDSSGAVKSFDDLPFSDQAGMCWSFLWRGIVITIGSMLGATTVKRTVKNVGSTSATYTASASMGGGIAVTVTPATPTTHGTSRVREVTRSHGSCMRVATLPAPRSSGRSLPRSRAPTSTCARAGSRSS